MCRIQLTLAQSKFLKHSIGLQWIPGDAQIDGNVEVDRLAAEAHDRNVMELTTFTTGEAKTRLHHLRERRSRQCWLNETSTETLLPQVDQDLKLPPHTGTKRKYDPLVHPLRLEVAFTNSFLFRIK